MNCPACAHENRPGAKFCEECAAPLPRLCASCGSELRPNAKFCDECGAAFGPGPAPLPAESSGARKVVTIVFADLVGSTALHERLDPESARRFMESYYAATRGAVELHGGTVTQLLGDGVKAVFGIPRVAEDDAIRAVRAAVAMQQAFRALAEQQRDAVGKTGLRVAVNTGEVVANDESEIIGDPVNVAARLQEQGRDGDVVIGEATERLVGSLLTLEPLGTFALKGRTEAVAAFRVTSLDQPMGAAAAAFVGRDDELARIQDVFETAVAKPVTSLATLLGSPGLGKSRLIEELARRLGDGATIIRAHCDAAGGSSFAPLADALRTLPGLDAAVSGSDAERTRILEGVHALLAGSPASPEETFFVVRRLLSSLAATKPVVLVIDDVHWAEPLLLDLIEHLVQWGSGVPLLVLVGARPELREIRSTLATPGGLVSDVVTLAGLDAGAAMRLAANVIGAEDLPASVAAKVLAASEGNPLFVGELVRMLVHEGALKREGDRWTAGTSLAALEMPPTILALLAARIERLRPEERVVLERAAVIGRAFSRSAVAELLSRDVTDLDARLESLRRAELIERDIGWFLGEPVLRFHHVLIRDAAYRRILKGTRAELHARFADWVEARTSESVEHDETIGWHLEQAHQHLRELGPIDARGRALGERAAQRLAAAGRRALARDDVRLASGLLGRALDRLDRDDVARAELALDWCEALLASGDVAPATGALEELDRFAASDARLRAWHTCFAGQLTTLTAPQGLGAAADAVAKAASDLAALGDVAGEAKAHFVHAQAFARLGKVGACEAALDRALAAARRAGDRRRANTVLAVAPLAALWGPSPVTRASGRCLDVVRVLRITQGAPAVEAVALSCQGVLEALRGRSDAARRMVASARKMVEELGITQRLLEADVFAARIDLLDGDAASAERGLRTAYEGMRELGLGIDAARAAALLARALLLLDRAGEAEALTRESEQLAGDDLQAAIAWRGARAEALARRGETVEAVALATKAVEIAAATDALLDHADARLALAAALRAAGRMTEADTEERRATELWEAKGATLLAERARSESARPAAVAAPPVARVEPLRPARLHVRANAATATGVRFEAAVAARDIDVVQSLFSDPCVVVHHPTGLTYGHRQQLTTWKSLLRAEHLTYRREVLATLGDSLELVRHAISVSGFAEERLKSSGPIDLDEIVIVEDDGHGRYRRSEIFASDRLGDAITCMYERYAELLPEGVERAVAAASAQGIGAMQNAAWRDDARLVAAFSPDIELTDSRTLGTWSARGTEAAVGHFRSVREVARGATLREDDVLCLEPGMLLVRCTHSGTERLGGGAYERLFLMLLACGRDGRLARIEWFDVDCEAEALARFDALTAKPEPARSAPRRVRPNAASAALARFASAFAVRNVDVVESLYADPLVVVDHPNGASYGRAEELETIRQMLRAPDARWAYTPLATLGDVLSLDRRGFSGSRSPVGSFDVAEYEVESVAVTEVDARGRFQRREPFALDHLGDALARLYERYAELLPEGPVRERAATTARSLAALLAPPDIDRITAALASSVETIDHKLLGYGKARGADAVLRAIRTQLDTADDIAPRIDDVLALESRALLARRTVSGASRVGGGRYEKEMISLYVCGSNGLVEHWEQFDPDREAEALARFDALAGTEATPSAPPFENAASRTDHALLRSFNARDWSGILACAASELVFDERRRMVRNTCDREVWLSQFRFLFDVPASRFTTQLLATRGERLSLNLHCFEGEVADGGGPLAMDDQLALHEVDRDGRIVAIVLFDQADLDAAYAELDARYEAGEDKTHAASVTVMREFTRAIASRDWEPMLALCSPALVEHDHRPLAVLGTTRGAEAWVQNFRVLADLAPDSRYRVSHFRASPRGFCSVGVWHGTREGGPYELPLVAVIELDAYDRIARADIYDADQLEQARARFDALVGSEMGPPESRFANAASRLIERGAGRLWAARDWDGIVAEISPAIRMDDRRRLVRLEIGYDDFLAQFRMIFDQPRSRWRSSLVATRGERLSLHRTIFEAEVGGGGGPLAFDEHLSLTEVDADGRWIAAVTFDLDAVDAAYAELHARFDAGRDGAHERVLKTLRAIASAWLRRDWEAMTAQFSPTLVCHDHRLLGWGTLHGASAFVATQRTLADLAPDARYRFDHLRVTERGYLLEGVALGTRDGGAFEWAFLRVTELDALGKIARIDLYDTDRLDEALARFGELADEASRPLGRFENVASRAWREVFEAWRRRDVGRFARLHPPALRYRDHRRMFQLDLDREQFLEFTRPLLEIPTARSSIELLATRAERLALFRQTMEMESGDVGPSAIDSLLVVETAESGEIIAYERFELDDVDAAYSELQARFDAAGEGVHPRVLEAMRTNATAWRHGDWEAMTAQFSPTLVCHDHRLLGWGTLHGAAAFVATQRTLAELAPDARYRFDHIRVNECGYLHEALAFGTRDGGAFELPFLRVTELDALGKIARIDLYDTDRIDEARARFDALASEASRESRFANAASRAGDRTVEPWRTRDWQAVAESLSAEFRLLDRRRIALLDLDRERYLDSMRFLSEMESTQIESELLATRGDRLALMRRLVQVAGGDVRPSAIENLALIELDERGDIVAEVRFDLDELDAAYAELHARFDAGGDGAHERVLKTLRAIASAWLRRDWEAMTAQFSPTLVCHDHRLLGWGALHGAAAFVATQRTLAELAPDARYRFDHLRVAERGYLLEGLALGTRYGGAFEWAFLRVTELDALGKIARIDLYDTDRLDEALARFGELADEASRPLGRFENVASRAWREVMDAWRRRDIERFARLHPPALRYRDHRPMFQLDLDREQFLEFTRPLLQMRFVHASIDLLATRGERLALFRQTMEMESGDVGPSAIDSLLVVETAESGEIVAYERFDLDALDRASTELDARFDAREGATHARALEAMRSNARTFLRRDWEAMAALFSPILVCHDHRLLGWGTLHGVAAFVAMQRTLVELAPDARVRYDHVRVSERGYLQETFSLGTRDGGAFELPFLRVIELDAAGRIARIDLYDTDRLDEALARFDELRAKERRDPRAALSKPNAASAAMERWKATFDTGFASDDWQPMRALSPPDMHFDDRRRLALISGDRELMIASARERVAMGARPEMTTIGTAGDRVAILRVLWVGGPEDGRFEIEYLAVVEIDASGLILAFVFLDAEDARAAQREAWARWAAIDPAAAAVAAPIGVVADAYSERDWIKYRAVLADDLVVEDHRLAGMGRLDGADAYLASVIALSELAPITRAEVGWLWPAFDRHGAVTIVRRTGTVPDGGGEFEAEYLYLYLASRGRITRVEFFELDAADAALARFEELRPDPLRIPPNAAVRGLDHVTRLRASRDLAALRAIATDDFCFDDRGRRSLVRGGVDEWLSGLQFLAIESGARIDERLVATAGDRLALHHVVWSEPSEAARFQIDRFRVVEVDAAGKLRALVLFDPDQRADASAELFERWVASGADGVPAAEIEFLRAWNAHDLGRMRALLPDEFVHDDRRRAGLGRVEGADAYVASAAALYELSPDVRIEELYCVVGAKHARVSVVRRFGTNTEGGQAEAYFIRLPRYRGEQLVGVDAFELEDMAAALARFEELRADPLRIPANAATRLSDRAALAIAAGDRASLRACASSDFRFEDRGKRALVVGDTEVWLDSVSFLGFEHRARLEPELLATIGDRIAVYRDAWSGSNDGGGFELGGIRVFELDDQGKLRALLLFDSEDRGAAFGEAIGRFASGEAAGCLAVGGLAAFLRGINERDWHALREAYTADFVLTDSRPLGLGVLDLDAWVASLQATVELSVGLAFEVVQVLTWNDRGVVVKLRRHGSMPDGGGPFENFPIGVALNRGDRISHYELFEETDAARALARFAELCATAAVATRRGPAGTVAS